MVSSFALSIKLALGTLALVANLPANASAEAASAPEGAEQRRQITIDELLKLKTFGEATFSPRGDMLVFVETPAEGGYPDFGLTVLEHWGRILVAHTQGQEPARELFEHEERAVYRPRGFSPDGRFLLVQRIKEGHASLGVYDRDNDVVRYFPQTPAIDLVHDVAPVWLSETQFVFVALPPGEEPYGVLSRRSTGERLYRAWNQTWEGKQASFAVNYSRAHGGGNTPMQGELVRADASTGEVERLADGLYESLRLSPSRRYLVALLQHQQAQPPADRLIVDWSYSRNELQIFDLQAGTRRRIEDIDVSYGSPQWSPAKDEIAFFGVRTGGSMSEGRFHRYDLRTGSIRVVEHTGLDLASEREVANDVRPFRVAWIGDDIAVVARPNADKDPTPRFTPKGGGYYNTTALDRRDWFLLSKASPPRNLTAKFHEIEPGVVSNDANGAYFMLDGNLWRVSSKDRLLNLTAGQDSPLAIYDAALTGGRKERPPHKSVLTLVGQSSEGVRKVVVVDLKSRLAPRLSTIGSVGSLMAISPATGAAAALQTDDRGRRVLMYSGSTQPRQLAVTNEFVGRLAKPVRRSISYTAADGRQLTSCALLPPNYVAGRRYPVVAHAYPGWPGPRPDTGCRQEINIQDHPAGQFNALIASAGYIAYDVANPYDLIRTDEAPLARIVEVVDRGLDALIEQGYGDPHRIAHFGISGSGYSGLWMAGKSDRFKAIVTISGLSNNLAHYFSTGIDQNFYSHLWPFNGDAVRYEYPPIEQFSVGATPWDDPMRFWRMSPIAYAKQINTPILLISGDMDNGFSGQFEQMFMALTRWRKEAQFVRYWGEGHGITSPANARDMWERTLRWFGEYLN